MMKYLVLVIVVGVVALGVVALLRSGPSDPQLDAADSDVSAVDFSSEYDPVQSGEPTPQGFRQLLARDQIPPIYDPTFTSADDVDWPTDSLVVGVAGVTEAKAYPVTHLNRHEMVNDIIEGEPILVSW